MTKERATFHGGGCSPFKRCLLLCHPERSRGICSSADASWKCGELRDTRPHLGANGAAALLQVDRDTGRNPQQVLVIAGKVGQPGISVVRLNRAEGKMSPILHIEPNPDQYGH